MTTQSCGCYLFAHIGMVLPSSICILILLWTYWTNSPLRLAKLCVAFPMLGNLGSFHIKPPVVNGQKQREPRWKMLVQSIRLQSSNTKNPADSKMKKAPGFRKKMYNINTSKHHSLGDNVQAIRERGTTDSYSAEPVSFLSHSKQILQSDTLCSFYNRESLNIELWKPNTKEPIKSSLLINSLRLKGTRCTCGSYKENIFHLLAKQCLSI